jgi:predicted molibdopterin-dependent oxidoreductase YjgC
MTRRSALDTIWPEAAVEIHPADTERLSLATGDWVKVSSRRGEISLRVLVTGRSPEGTIFIPFHFAEAAANILTDNRIDPRAKIPDFKMCAVSLMRIDPPEGREEDKIPLTERGAIRDRSQQVH